MRVKMYIITIFVIIIVDILVLLAVWTRRCDIRWEFWLLAVEVAAAVKGTCSSSCLKFLSAYRDPIPSKHLSSLIGLSVHDHFILISKYSNALKIPPHTFYSYIMLAYESHNLSNHTNVYRPSSPLFRSCFSFFSNLQFWLVVGVLVVG